MLGGLILDDDLEEFIAVPSCLDKQANLIDKILALNLKAVIVVEKDTVFQRIMASSWFQDNYQDKILLMTAKGYPDYSSRDFLNQLMNKIGSIPCIYLGDADPYGTDIYFQYLIANSL